MNADDRTTEITYVGLRRYSWWVNDPDGSGIGGWTLTKWGAKRQIAKVLAGRFIA